MKQEMDRQHGVELARNILNTKVAKALLDDNRFPERTLKIELDRIKSDTKKQINIHENNQRLFRHKGLIYNFEPTIVVERPASPLLFQNQMKYYEVNENTPHYMTGLKKHKPQMYIPMATVDAFKVVRKKKKNLWQTENTEKDLTDQFKSIVLKSHPLSSAERRDLESGWNIYRPISQMEEQIKKQLHERKTERARLAQSVKPRPPNRTFITQMEEEEFYRARQQRRSTMITNLSTRREQDNNGASILLEPKRKPQIDLEFDKEQLHNFERLRETQKKKYHKYIR